MNTDPVKAEVIDYISAALGIKKDVLSDEFDVAEYIEKVCEGRLPEVEDIEQEDYALFWREFVTHFGIYDPTRDFDAHSKKHGYGLIRKILMWPLFKLHMIGEWGVLSKALVRDLVETARKKKISPEINIFMYKIRILRLF